MPSTVIRDFAYDPRRGDLEVTFVSGRRYRYRHVPAVVVERFQRAISKGRFFNTRIRNRFAFEEIGETLH